MIGKDEIAALKAWRQRAAKVAASLFPEGTPLHDMPHPAMAQEWRRFDALIEMIEGGLIGQPSPDAGSADNDADGGDDPEGVAP